MTTDKAWADVLSREMSLAVLEAGKGKTARQDALLTMQVSLLAANIVAATGGDSEGAARELAELATNRLMANVAEFYREFQDFKADGKGKAK